ncbi:nucleotidyltransferase domain-containing protein [Moorena sp. SIO3H5]|uniref:nucleotidyltransferase domain-containing protein n=1 Tax=Moorena sp. SIO3H5 TaxID=2607834 RepID=UPI0013B98BDE|nr:nucleotidyltransferase domain-containing protein [Moorena sp. SIO3H5]NEO69610.1 nucleotidyltransferase domain-containing protein [Moorena sp. SIO3H5]
MNPHLILPVGTQVVTRVAAKNSAGETLCVQGAVAVIVKAPTDDSHAYRVRLTNDREVTLRRHEFSIRKHFQKEGLQLSEDLLTELNLYDHVIYRCVVGSRAFGLDDENSDIDRRGIYLPPAVVHWSLYGIPEQLENHETQECYWELQKFIILALKANPNVLECLYTPLVETATSLAEELLAIRDIFLSKLVYQTYNGYVMSQFKKMEQDFRTKGAVRLKHAMHLIRLLLSGITVLKEGFVPVKVEEYRQQLLAIRRDEMPWEEVTAWRLSLHQEFDAAFANTNLPERPDYEAANEFLIRARQSRV